MGLYRHSAANLGRNLIAYWPGNEANGNLLDAHINGLTLTDKNTVTSASGRVYATARKYVNANHERHTRASAVLLQGNTSFTWATWVYLTSKLDYAHIVSKWTGVVGGRCYLIRYNGGATNRFYFEVRNSGDTAYGNVTASYFGDVSLNTWHLVIASYDEIRKLLTISVNAGPVNAKAWDGGVLAGTGTLQIGSQEDNDADAYSWDGYIGPTMFWKSTAGCGGVLTAEQRKALWNDGHGLSYQALLTATQAIRRQWFYYTAAAAAYWPLLGDRTARKETYGDRTGGKF